MRLFNISSDLDICGYLNSIFKTVASLVIRETSSPAWRLLTLFSNDEICSSRFFVSTPFTRDGLNLVFLVIIIFANGSPIVLP
jgi:hypothetical protein